MSESSGVRIKKYNQEVCFVKISVKDVNYVIAAFQLFFIGIGLTAFNRELSYELRKDVDKNNDWLIVWNGNLQTFCKNTSAPTEFPSFFKRFELEPYAKLGFKFALMYPATAQRFPSFIPFFFHNKENKSMLRIKLFVIMNESFSPLSFFPFSTLLTFGIPFHSLFQESNGFVLNKNV